MKRLRFGISDEGEAIPLLQVKMCGQIEITNRQETERVEMPPPS